MYGFAIAYALFSSLSGANSRLSLCRAIWHLNIKSHEGDSGLSRGFGAYFGKKLLAASEYAMRALHKVPKRPILFSPQIWGVHCTLAEAGALLYLSSRAQVTFSRLWGTGASVSLP